VYPGPGAYEADEGLRRMLERVRVKLVVSSKLRRIVCVGGRERERERCGCF
jgi:hypothetical protein